MIRHNRNLGENDARFRYVESIFVETADGERHRLPFTNLAGGRAMLEHVRQGGKPYDVRGNHICEMITELKVLARFNRASQGRVVEGVKQSVVEGAQTYYKSLRENIKRLSSPRGYSAYFESWHPASITEQDQLVEDIKTLFVEQTIDDRIEQALPLLAKIQQGREMKEAEIFENWVNNVTEGTWSLPETPEQMTRLKELMSGELIVGPDGTNATEQLYDLIGDDVLFDRIDALAAQDPRANVWDDTDVQARLQELGIQMPDRAAPDMAAQSEQGVAEGKEQQWTVTVGTKTGGTSHTMTFSGTKEQAIKKAVARFGTSKNPVVNAVPAKQGVAEGSLEENKGMTGYNAFKREWRAKHGADAKVPAYDSKEYTSYVYRQNDKKQGVAEADNIAAFESLQRMRHLSGMKLEENVLNDAGSTLAHIMTTHQRDVRDFAQTGEMSSDLYDALYDYYFNDMPYGVKKARSGDPYEWISDRFAEDILSNAPADKPHQSDGQTVGQVMSQVGTRGLSGRPAPLAETQCNSTMEGHFCPVHGLSECWSQGMYEDILSTGIQLAEDDKTNEGILSTAFKNIARAADDSNVFKIDPTGQKMFNNMKIAPEPTAKDIMHRQNVKKGYNQRLRDYQTEFEPIDSPSGVRAAKTQDAAVDAQNNMQSNQDRMKDAYGIDEADAPAQNRAKGFTSPYFQSRQLPGKKWWGSDGYPPLPTDGSDPNNTPNKGNSRSRYFLPHSDEPVVQPPTMNRIDPDTDIPGSDGPYPVSYSNRDDLGPPVFDQEPLLRSFDQEPPLSSLDKAPRLPNNTVTNVDVTRESREGDALLARIKSLALIK